jgi:pimeloyl-ACP methyl ester carboxylesterase/DNA-binding SARP family transcriptional activator
MFRSDLLAARASGRYNPPMGTPPAVPIEIKLFGGLEIHRGGEPVALPQSKKTRALLAYLILTGTPQRRDALCELLWEIPDDPRAALRWSLSKLRPLVNDETAERLTADRERVAFDRRGAAVDMLRVEKLSADGLESQSRAQLIEECKLFGEPLLAGLDLPSQPAYESWRLGRQERARQIHLRILDELTRRNDSGVDQQTELLRRRVELDPDNEDAHVRLIAHLASAGQRADGEAQIEISRRMLQSVGPFDDARLKSALHGAAKKAAPASKPAPPLEPATQLRQNIRFGTAADDVRIAYATAGSGPPLVKTANWLNHLEFDWESPIWRHMFRALSKDNTLIRYDSRGNGLSDWNVENLTLDAFVEDLKAVVDAAGVERFPLFALSQGCAFAIEFAVRYPERVSKLVLFGGYARGWRVRANAVEIAQVEAMITLARNGWGRSNPGFRQVFTSQFIPGATREQGEWFNELQRRTTSPENAAKMMDALGRIDVSHRLASVTQPTLVLHAKGDILVPYAEGRQLASGIRGAKFVTLESQNHLLLEQEPAWPRFLAEFTAFLTE